MSETVHPDVQRFLSQPESQTWERKRSLALAREAFESLCGMVNTEAASGTVVFGVGPEGESVGVEPGDLDRAQQSMRQKIKAKFEPQLQYSIDVVVHSEKNFLLVRAHRHR